MRFFTVSDARFYVGTVALLNSLRLCGHTEQLVVLDGGLSVEQRRTLSDHCTVFDVADRGYAGFFAKPFPFLTEFEGLAVLLDSDMIVTDSLVPLISPALDGKLCVFPDHPVDRDRFFEEWASLLSLGAPLRRSPYVNSGFLALVTTHWPGLLERWWDVSALVARRLRELEPSEQGPVAQHDQDALNAILMSEVPDGCVQLLPEYAWDLRSVVVKNPGTLHCVGSDGRRQVLLHAPLSPKVWQTGGWRRAWPDAYVRLLPRVLFSPDVTLRLERRDVPPWIRPGHLPQLSQHVFAWYNPVRGHAIRARRAPRRVLRELRAVVGRTPRS